MNIKDRIAHITGWMSDLFAKIPHDIKKYAAEALQITTAIKVALQSDFAAAAVAAIPGSWDDELRAGAIELIDALTKALLAIEGTTLDGAGKNDLIDGALNTLHGKLIGLQDGNVAPKRNYLAFAGVNYAEKASKA